MIFQQVGYLHEALNCCLVSEDTIITTIIIDAISTRGIIIVHRHRLAKLIVTSWAVRTLKITQAEGVPLTCPRDLSWTATWAVPRLSVLLLWFPLVPGSNRYSWDWIRALLSFMIHYCLICLNDTIIPVDSISELFQLGTFLIWRNPCNLTNIKMEVCYLSKSGANGMTTNLVLIPRVS